MNKHELKIWPEHYRNVADGTKTFEIRVNDRGFQKGDEVVLRYFDPKKNAYDEHMRKLEFTIGCVYPIDAERVVFSLLHARLPY